MIDNTWFPIKWCDFQIVAFFIDLIVFDKSELVKGDFRLKDSDPIFHFVLTTFSKLKYFFIIDTLNFELSHSIELSLRSLSTL